MHTSSHNTAHLIMFITASACDYPFHSTIQWKYIKVDTLRFKWNRKQPVFWSQDNSNYLHE